MKKKRNKVASLMFSCSTLAYSCQLLKINISVQMNACRG